LLWASNKGLDVSDESFYLLNYRFPAVYHASFSTFHLITDFFSFHQELTVQGYRVLYLLTIIGQTLVFTFGFYRWANSRYKEQNFGLFSSCHKRNSFLFCLLFFLIASFLTFSIIPRTFSYNSLNSIAIYVSSGLVLYSLTLPDAVWKRRLALFLVGAVLSIGFFSKVSSAVIAFGVHALLLFITRKEKLFSFIVNSLGAIVIGFVAGCTLYFICIQPYGDWVFNFTREMKLIIKTSYGTVQMIRNYSGNVFQACVFLVTVGLPFLLACFIFDYQRNVPAQDRKTILRLLPLVLLGVFAYLLVRSKAFDNGYYNDEAAVKVLLVFVVGAILFFGAWRRSFWAGLNIEGIAVVLWLFVLPAVASYGTANSLLLNMTIDIASWFAILLVIAQESYQQFHIRGGQGQPTTANLLVPKFSHALLFLALPALFAFEQTIWGIIFRPYMLTQSLLQQTEKVTMPGIQGDLLVDQKSQVFLNTALSVLSKNGYKPGDKVIVLHDMPGLVYFLGGISPNAPWYFSFSLPRNLHALDLNPDAIKGSYLVVNKEFTAEELAGFKAHGINFPGGYQLIGELENPYTGFNPTQTVARFYKYSGN